ATRMEAQLLRLADAPDQVGAFAQLAEHVWAGHLGDAQALQRATARLAEWAPDDAARAALARANLAASLLSGSADVPTDMPRGAAIRAHGSAICGLASRGDAAGARRLWQAAEALAAAAEGDTAAAKAFAACCHNLAAQL